MRASTPALRVVVEKIRGVGSLRMGRFQELVNEGPVTILLDSKKSF
jgi:hypothetical protein